MNFIPYSIFITSLLTARSCFSQTDSAIDPLNSIPLKYVSIIDNKVDQYSKQITSKTAKTLKSLAAGKIKSGECYRN